MTYTFTRKVQLLWKRAIPYALSEAIARVIGFVTNADKWRCDTLINEQKFEPEEERLSNDQRDALLEAAGNGGDLFSPEFLKKIGASPEAVIRYTSQELGATDREGARQWADESQREWEAQQAQATKADEQPATESVAEVPDEDGAEKPEIATPVAELCQSELSEASHESRNESEENAVPETEMAEKTRGWTPERRAVAAERAKGQRKPPFDSDFEAVRDDFDAGMSCGKIARKWKCSEQHIRNFLMKHGVDPRRTLNGQKTGGRPPLAEDQIRLIIEEKAKGTPSAEIGEMIDRSEHAVTQKYSDLKKEGRVPPEHLTSEALAERNRIQNEIVSETMKEHHASKQAEPDDGPLGAFFRERDAALESDEDAGNDEEEDNDQVTTKESDDEEDEQPEALLSAIRVPVRRDPWESAELSPDDWPDIQKMLGSGATREKIAGDYDVPIKTLDAFIVARLAARKEPKEPLPGEARAPLVSEAGGAN